MMRRALERLAGHRILKVAAVSNLALVGIFSLVPKALRAELSTGAPGYNEHFIAYLFTGALLRLAFTRADPWVMIQCLVAYAAMLEALQNFVPGRMAQFIDFAFSGAGAAFGILLIHQARATER